MQFQPTSTTETQATSLLQEQTDQAVPTLLFTQVRDYTTFTAEHAFDGNDIVFHFFLTPEITPEQGGKEYWSVTFPEALSEVAQQVFQAGYPQLRAAFTAEQDSWWMRANGFAVVGIPEERVTSFYAELDQALDARNVKKRPD